MPVTISKTSEELCRRFVVTVELGEEGPQVTFFSFPVETSGVR